VKSAPNSRVQLTGLSLCRPRARGARGIAATLTVELPHGGHGRFATIFASGCLAIRFEALPLTKQELLAAILMCERDHLAFIDHEVRELRLSVLPTTGAPIPVAEIVCGASSIVTAATASAASSTSARQASAAFA
jgi:hypothetical protein